MFYNPESAAKKAKAESEKILTKRYEVYPELPLLIRSDIREHDEFVDRALILDAMLHIHFNMPTEQVAAWIEKHNLSDSLTAPEQDILNKPNDELTEEEKIRVFWYIESLWAMLWVGSRINKLTINTPCEEFMSTLCPNIQKDDDKLFRKRLKLRTLRQVFFIFDLHFRLHYYAVNTDEPKVNPLIIQARRKSLDWVLSPDKGWEEINFDFDA